MIDTPRQYLSAASLKQIKQQYEELKNVRIPEIADRINEAKQQGDLSENAEYTEAKENMAWAQGKLMELEQIINNAEIIDERAGKSGVVDVGSTLTVKSEGKERTFTIVGPQEANPVQGKISNESPLGEGFIGHRQGDMVEITTPAKKITYQIVSIQ